MTIKPVLVPDHDAASLRRLMDHFATASTGPTKRQLTESRAAVAAAQGVTEGAEKEYHVINHKGTPTVVSPNGKMNKNFSSTYDAQQFAKKKNAEIDKKKRVSESDSGTVDMKGKKCTTCKKGTYEETDIHDNMHGELHCTKCNTVVKSRQPADSKKKRVSEGIMDVVKQTFNDCVAGYPQGTSEGQFLQGWARAIRAETGRDIPAEKLTKLYQDYTQRSPEIMQSHGTIDEGKELKAIDGDYYEDSTDFFSMFDQDHFDREEESEDGMEIRGYIDDVCVMVFKYSTPDMMGGWGHYDDSALVAEAAKWRTHPDAHDHDTDGSPVPKGGIKSDPLSIRQGVSRTQSEKDPKSLAGKFGDKYAKKHGVPTKQLMKNIPLDDIDEQGVAEGADGAAGVKYGVFAKGGSVGSQRFRDDPLKTFDSREEATADARRRRSALSPGERGYYRMGYVVKPIKGEVDEGMIDNIKNTVRAANYDRLARRSNSQAVAGGGFAPPAQFKSLSAKGDQRAQKAQDIRKGDVEEGYDAGDAYDKWDPKHPDFVKNYRKFQASNPGATLKDFIADLKKSVTESIDPIEQLRADIKRFAQ